MQQQKCYNNGFNKFGWNDISKVLDDIFTGAGNIFGQDHAKSTVPANVLEYSDRLEIELAAPGFTKTDFNLSVEGDVLTVSAKKENPNVKDSVKVQRKEFDYSTFKRSFRLSDKFDIQRVTARYENGILSVGVPEKAKATKESFRIEVL